MQTSPDLQPQPKPIIEKSKKTLIHRHWISALCVTASLLSVYIARDINTEKANKITTQFVQDSDNYFKKFAEISGEIRNLSLADAKYAEKIKEKIEEQKTLGTPERTLLISDIKFVTFLDLGFHLHNGYYKDKETGKKILYTSEEIKQIENHLDELVKYFWAMEKENPTKAKTFSHPEVFSEINGVDSLFVHTPLALIDIFNYRPLVIANYFQKSRLSKEYLEREQLAHTLVMMRSYLQSKERLKLPYYKEISEINAGIDDRDRQKMRIDDFIKIYKDKIPNFDEVKFREYQKLRESFDYYKNGNKDYDKIFSNFDNLMKPK